MRPLLLLIFPVMLISCENASEKKASTFKAGFQTFHFTDRERMYRVSTDSSDYLHFRPVDIDMWYPVAATATDSVLLYRDMLGLLDKRVTYYTDAPEPSVGMAQGVAQFYSEGLRCADSTRVLNSRTGSIGGAPFTDGKFPLVIYLTAFNGMSYENVLLFEQLAKNGFVVVSISSIGRYPGDMTMKNADLLEQVYDALAAVKSLRNNPAVNFSSIGIIGYSWGGLAGIHLADKIPGLACIVSFDGSEFHKYTGNRQEDADFDSTRYGGGFHTLQVNVPYLRLESDPSLSPVKADSIYTMHEKFRASPQIFIIDSARHEDFGSFAAAVKTAGNCPVGDVYGTVSGLTVSFLQEHLKGKSGFEKTVAEFKGKKIRTKQ